MKPVLKFGRSEAETHRFEVDFFFKLFSQFQAMDRYL